MHEASRWIAAKTVIRGEQMTFEDLEPKNVTRKPADLSTWNIEDLRDYIENMKAEIQRAEAMIAEKQSVSSAADALFKR